MNNLSLEKYQLALPIVDKAATLYASDVLKKDMQAFFEPKDKREKALLFGAFCNYHHGKIQDAFTACFKGYAQTQDPKYKDLLYLNGIIKRLK